MTFCCKKLSDSKLISPKKYFQKGLSLLLALFLKNGRIIKKISFKMHSFKFEIKKANVVAAFFLSFSPEVRLFFKQVLSPDSTEDLLHVSFSLAQLNTSPTFRKY